MNIICQDILVFLKENIYSNQRILASKLNYSLGMINKSFNLLKNDGYINDDNLLTDKALSLLEDNKVDRAIILAAGFGKRMVPINNEISKGLLKIEDETLVERMIKQLNEKNIFNIYIVVGFMKEYYEYLIDQYGVKLLYNGQYKDKDNLFSVYKAINYLENSYVLPCNVYCKKNPFKNYEFSSTLFFQSKKKENNFKLKKDFQVIRINKKVFSNDYSGIGFFHKNDFEKFKFNILELIDRKENAELKWEDAIFYKNMINCNYRNFNEENFYTIDTYEQLRELDENSINLKNNILNLISDVFKIDTSEIKNIEILKKGMTNNSFIFQVKNQRYIMRVPGNGSNILINRSFEYEVYKKIIPLKLSEEIIYIDKESGYKIAKFIDNARVCDPMNKCDVEKVVKFLKKFHDLDLKVKNKFDLLKTLNFYEKLRGKKSFYKDYSCTKEKIIELISFVSKIKKRFCLCHIDSISDNFLFDERKIYLIDWEYAGMQDPHLDIAMFCIYAMYDREMIDEVIDIYFKKRCSELERDKIYAYVAICGLIWSNWCEYKANLGNDFSDYSLKQYRYSKEYFKILDDKYRFMEKKYE